MATTAEWLEGARPRTLPTAIAPVLAGTAIAIADGGARWGLATLCLVVALGLVIGVNFANDYSDGIRGSDGEDRVGPLRLVGSGVAEPSHVKAAAFRCFGVSAVAGLVITISTGHWWFLILGLACILAAWFYTGGSHPYGYAGLGEVFVFVFFGLVAVGGTVYVQTDHVGAAGWVTASLIGFLACAVLVANNLRDIDGDRTSGPDDLVGPAGPAHDRLARLPGEGHGHQGHRNGPGAGPQEHRAGRVGVLDRTVRRGAYLTYSLMPNRSSLLRSAFELDACRANNSA